MLTKYNNGSFDVVIMCNVFHEIEPNQWLDLFRHEGTVTSLLSENGILLLVEDQQMPIGEMAHQKGFLVLDTPQIKELFKISECDTDFKFYDKYGDGRLKAHYLPKRVLAQIDTTSKIKALKSLSKNAKDNILNIRTMEKNYKNGKLHGLWTQMFTNAQLSLDELT